VKFPKKEGELTPKKSVMFTHHKGKSSPRKSMMFPNHKSAQVVSKEKHDVSKSQGCTCQGKKRGKEEGALSFLEISTI
jgi:hypothetical protein